MPRETAKDREIVREAQKRFKACQEWEGSCRKLWNEDQKFAEGDSDNLNQWDATQVNSRTMDPNGARPCLTINKTRQHCLQILNDMRQNKAQIEIRPTGDGATYDSAKIFEGVMRYIEYRSNATEAYEAASRHQIYGGWGYIRVLTEYSEPTSFDQDIKIQRVADPLSIYLDPDIEEFDGSDARFGFVFRDVPRDRFEAEYPQFKDVAGSKALCDEGRTWDDGEHVRVAEYYRRKEVPDTLYALSDGSTMLRSEIPADLREEFDAKYGAGEAISTEGNVYVMAERETFRYEVEWFKIAGNRIVDRRPWPGKFIPLARVIGEETVIDGVLDRKGHVRALKDPQRMYNYYSSGGVEHVALQGKSPYTAPAAAIEGFESYWKNANRENFSVLPYNHVDDAGQPIPPPQRQQPPQSSSAYAQGMQVAAQEMMMVSGQYQAQMGAPSNERSGVAIQQRQRQGDNATYHYIDHLAQAIRFVGRICLDLIPKVYDVERVLKIMAENGSQSDVHIDPNAPQPVMKMIGDKPASDEQLKAAQADPNLRDQVRTIFNPNVGKYSVESDIGPAYATRRQEAFQALSQLMQQNQELARIAGDLLFKAADFPMADEIAERIKRTIPPNVLGEADPPAMAQLQQQNQQLQQAIQQLQGMLASKQAKEQGEAENANDRHMLDSYRAETDRMKALSSVDPAAFRPLVRQLIGEALGVDLDSAMDAHAARDAARAAIPEMMAAMPPEQPAPGSR